jgi:hypothetical protein
VKVASCWVPTSTQSVLKFSSMYRNVFFSGAVWSMHAKEKVIMRSLYGRVMLRTYSMGAGSS